MESDTRILPLRKIVSGGQTGADRAALDWALSHGFPHGGWCPRGRLAEDGSLPPRYLLTETPSAKYPERTRWNIRDSDATVLFTMHVGGLTGGTLLTAELADQSRKPVLHLWPSTARDGRPHPDPAGTLQRFLATNRVRILNVAGPRASQQPEIYRFAWDTLESALATHFFGTMRPPIKPTEIAVRKTRKVTRRAGSGAGPASLATFLTREKNAGQHKKDAK